jgi:acyl-coenzyme A synthetase/AMP-(fatty) acid ligase
MSLVRARRNPITGAVVTADVVLADGATTVTENGTDERIRLEILDACRAILPAHKVPALIRFVSSLEMSASGKLVRPSA